MKAGLYVIYDNVAEESGPVFEAINDGVALRQFNHTLRNKEGLDVDDYDLYHVGSIEHTDNLVFPFGPVKVTPKLSMVDKMNDDLEVAGENHG